MCTTKTPSEADSGYTSDVCSTQNGHISGEATSQTMYPRVHPAYKSHPTRRKGLCPSDRYGPTALSPHCVMPGFVRASPCGAPRSRATGGYAVRRAQAFPLPGWLPRVLLSYNNSYNPANNSQTIARENICSQV